MCEGHGNWFSESVSRMCDRYVQGKRLMIFFAAVMLLCLSGCAGGGAALGPGGPPKAREMVSPVHPAVDRITAIAQIELVTAQGHYPIRAAMILQRPSYLRLEMLPVIGTPDFFLTASPDELRIFIPSQNEFYSGKPTAENLSRFLPWSFTLEEIVMILSSAYPPLDGANVSQESHPDGALLRVDMRTPAGPSQTIWMAKNERLVKLIRYDSLGRETYQAVFDDYRPGSALAGKIVIQWADNVTSVSVKYSDLNVEKNGDPSIFKLPAPPGSKPIHLD
ncbi:MAG: DUF4292 domain-containing protein [Deltaproteobacteria bacterium]|nr:DUF4292 domain-containing protein [Deltaproteobacteria bacterium]